MTIKEGWRGRFFEDFVGGDVYEDALGRTITSADNTLVHAADQNTAPDHFDHHARRRPSLENRWSTALLPSRWPQDRPSAAVTERDGQLGCRTSTRLPTQCSKGTRSTSRSGAGLREVKIPLQERRHRHRANHRASTRTALRSDLIQAHRDDLPARAGTLARSAEALGLCLDFDLSFLRTAGGVP